MLNSNISNSQEHSHNERARLSNNAALSQLRDELNLIDKQIFEESLNNGLKINDNQVFNNRKNEFSDSSKSHEYKKAILDQLNLKLKDTSKNPQKDKTLISSAESSLISYKIYNDILNNPKSDDRQNLQKKIMDRINEKKATIRRSHNDTTLEDITNNKANIDDDQLLMNDEMKMMQNKIDQISFLINTKMDELEFKKKIYNEENNIVL